MRVKALLGFTLIFSLLISACGPVVENRLATGTAMSAVDGQPQHQPQDVSPTAAGETGGGASFEDERQAENNAHATVFAQATSLSLTGTAVANADPQPPSQTATQSETTDTPQPGNTGTPTQTPTDVGAALTSVAHTLTAIATQLTVSPTATVTATPTATITPTPDGWTPSPTPAPCNAFRFVADITFPPGSVIASNTTIYKTWRIQNVGTCTWDGDYSVVFHSGDQLGSTTELEFNATVLPGQYVNITIPVVTPPVAGTYQTNWGMQDDQGDFFGSGPNADQPLTFTFSVPGVPPGYGSPVVPGPVSTDPGFTPAPTP